VWQCWRATGPGGDLVQKRLEQVKIPAVHKRDLDGRPLKVWAA